MTTRTARVAAATSRVAVTYRAQFLDAERLELTLDCSGDLPDMLNLKVSDPKNTVVCERIIRDWPYKVAFKAAAVGKYRVELFIVGGDKPKVRFTWADWENDFAGGGSPDSLPNGVQSIAFIDVT
jgi:hypothetical protein